MLQTHKQSTDDRHVHGLQGPLRIAYPIHPSSVLQYPHGPEITVNPVASDQVYYSSLAVIRRVGLISLNELSDETYNAFAKCFASQRKVKEQAFQVLEHVSYELVSATVMTFLVRLRQY